MTNHDYTNHNNFLVNINWQAARIANEESMKNDLQGVLCGAAAWIAVLDEGEQAGPRRAATHRNFELLAVATARLGGVPRMLTADDCCAPGGPHEHAIIGLVTFSLTPLLTASKLPRICQTLQRLGM